MMADWPIADSQPATRLARVAPRSAPRLYREIREHAEIRTGHLALLSGWRARRR